MPPRDAADDAGEAPELQEPESEPEEGAEVAAEPAAADEATAAARPGGPADEVALLRDRWLRAEAELQNFRRRAQREWEEVRRSAEERVLTEMIGVLDDLERAVGAAAEEGADPSWVEGVRLTVQRLGGYLSRHGVEVVDPVGEPFDPRFHEALLEVDAAEGVEPGHVVQVALKGYRRGERALRAARVVVARASEASR